MCQNNVNSSLTVCANMRQIPGKNSRTLNSWKEVASYLGRGVRTVQRWEAELQLPVYRMGNSERGPVFAFRAELDNWLRKQAGAERQSPCIAANSTKPDHIGNSLSALDRSARLTTETLRLIQTQRSQTRLIAEQLRRMAHLVPTIGKVGFTLPVVREEAASAIALRRSPGERRASRASSPENT
jgi:hypothetical protein